MIVRRMLTAEQLEIIRLAVIRQGIVYSDASHKVGEMVANLIAFGSGQKGVDFSMALDAHYQAANNISELIATCHHMTVAFDDGRPDPPPLATSEIQWKHHSNTCPASKGCTGDTSCTAFPTVHDRIAQAKAAWHAYQGGDDTQLLDFVQDALLLGAAMGLPLRQLTILAHREFRQFADENPGYEPV